MGVFSVLLDTPGHENRVILWTLTVKSTDRPRPVKTFDYEYKVPENNIDNTTFQEVLHALRNHRVIAVARRFR
jgi:hypothetical protein